MGQDEFFHERWNRVVVKVEDAFLRIAVLRYLVVILVTLGTSWLMPAAALGDSRGVFPFLMIVGCAWYGGVGPGQVSLLLLIVSFRYRSQGFPDGLRFSSSDISTTAVLSVVIGVVGWAGSFRRRSLRLAQRQADELLDLHRRKDEFLATLAHELRNPLAPLRNGLEVLRMAAAGPMKSSDMGEIHFMMQRQLDLLVRLIDDLLDVSRINTGKITLRRELVRIADIIQDAVESSRPQIILARHELSISIRDESIVIRVDRARISQVLTNLLNNAAKFTDPGGRIAISVSTADQTIEIAVSDTGIGISGEMLPRVFEMFTQVPNPLSRVHGGLGIGLSLARALTEMHGGSVAAYSQGVGQGSRFVIRLPKAVDVDADHCDAIDAGVTRAAQAAGLRILIVDDNQDAAKSLAVLLSANGHLCRTAADGVSALRTAVDFEPEAFLLDIGMPGMTGHELAKRLRLLPQFQHAVLIAITGWGQDEDRQRSREAGIDHHLVKPVAMEDLHALLAAASENNQESGSNVMKAPQR